MSAAVAVILAAGAGRRLGSVAKALLACGDGRTFLSAVQHSAAQADVTDLVVVVGLPHGPATEREARRLRLHVVHNPDPSRGMASSVACGFAHAAAHFASHDVALLWPVDHPYVDPATVAQVVTRTPRDGVAIPVYHDRGGHPTGFGRLVWPHLAACASAPQGARSVIHALDANRVVRFAVADSGVIADIDTPDQLARSQDPGARRDTLRGSDS